jgi:hypothetical protein
MLIRADPDRPSAQRNHDWAEEEDARDPAKREQHRLRVAIGISGWLSSPGDVHEPWEIIDSTTTEPFALRFELEAMLRLGNSLRDVLFNYAWDGITYTVVSRTMLGALYAGLWPLGLIKLASVLDNPFSVALARADKAGKVLAHALIDGVQGKRPVMLMGYSVGARVIYACLLELAEQHAFGLVESVVFMGAPVPSDNSGWTMIRSVVAARVVNVYSTEDYVLGYLYRSTKLEFGVAGLAAVKGVSGIENVNMSELVSGHDRYRYLAGKILVNIGFGDVNFDKVAEQERALEVAERKKQRAKEQTKKAESENRPADILFDQESMKPTSPSVINIMDEPIPSQTRPTQQPLRPRPAMYTQNNSRQQPMRHKSLVPDALASRCPELSPALSAPDSDPLGATTLIDTAPPTVRQRSFPTASAQSQRQMPSALVSDPAAQMQPLRTPAPAPAKTHSGSQGPITLIDTTAPAASNKPITNVTKTVTAVAVAEVVTAEEDEDDKASEFSAYDHVDSDDEVSSEFGELMMVEPVPMEDFDYGLM